MLKLATTFLMLILVATSTVAQVADALQQSYQLYQAVKMNDRASSKKYIASLAGLSAKDLEVQLNTEAKAKSFWINIYNTYVQHLLKAQPSLFDDRDDFFKEERITIAGTKLSLDDIEHGIIRRSKNKYSLGYFGKLFVNDFEERFRLKEVDYRVHFALNCGAKSCPPVALYTYDKIEQQLDAANKAYLQNVVKYEAKDNVAQVPVLCLWFSADFGGEAGVLDMLHRYEIIDKKVDPKIKYLDYDWTLAVGNYIER